LSLQECLTLQLVVTGGAGAQAAIEFTDLVWKGLRCTVAVEGQYKGLKLDIRTRAGEASSSVVLSTKPLKEGGRASVVVEDEDMKDQSAVVVLLDDNGALVAQTDTRIGGGDV
jgi:urocanate hydratase